jgi:transcriptional regulator with XRE-family HTH domain
LVFRSMILPVGACSCAVCGDDPRCYCYMRRFDMVFASAYSADKDPTFRGSWRCPVCAAALISTAMRSYLRFTARQQRATIDHAGHHGLRSMAKGSFGELLKREREMREISLNELTVATRVAPRFLEALENEDWAKLPGGVFNRGFVRAIARYLGLSEERFLAEYDLARGQMMAAKPAVRENPIPSPSRWLVVLLILLGVAGVVAGSMYGWRRYAARRSSKQAIRFFPPFQVTPADPAGVLLELNGQAVPFPGSPGGSATMVLSQQDLRQAHRGDTRP